MGSLNLNFSDIPESSFALPSEGEHTFVIEDASMQAAKADGTPVLKLKCSVDGGEEDGRTLLQFFSMKEAALWNFRNFLEQLMQETVEEIDIDPEDLVGQKFMAFVMHTDDGKYANLEAFDRYEASV